MSRRTHLTTAAIQLLGSDGLRQLTHRAVDARAGLAQGSTSNVFRTRAALIDGILAALVERETVVLDSLTAESAGEASAALMLDVAAGMVTDALGAGRAETLARRALFSGAALDPAVAEQLRRGSRRWWELIARLLRALGVPDEDRRARWLLAYLDGIISDQLARPEPGFDPRAAVAPALHGILQLPSPEPGAQPRQGEWHPTARGGDRSG